jgi:hypothetical protein
LLAPGTGRAQALDCAVPLDVRRFDLLQDAPGGDRRQGVHLLGALHLSRAECAGLKLTELSGIAWDEDEQTLYAVNDQGSLFHLRLAFADGRLVGAHLVQALRLQGEGAQPLRRRDVDAEGLAVLNGDDGLRDNSELVVSFERWPRIERYRPDGRRIGVYRLPEALRSRETYAEPNQALEAVTVHPRFGILTAPERPLRSQPADQTYLYGLDGARWRHPLAAAPASAIVAMEALPDGDVLVLERSFVSLLNPLVITLRRARLPPRSEPPPTAEISEVAEFSTAGGWLLDNFEGLTRHRDGRFLMVSDDNESSLQRTLLVYFELGEPRAGE